jgi:hypothetical protein
LLSQLSLVFLSFKHVWSHSRAVFLHSFRVSGHQCTWFRLNQFQYISISQPDWTSWK